MKYECLFSGIGGQGVITMGETLALATALARKGTDFELHDWKPARHDSLGHVFPVCMTWREESLRTLADIRRFSYDRC